MTRRLALIHPAPPPICCLVGYLVHVHLVCMESIVLNTGQLCTVQNFHQRVYILMIRALDKECHLRPTIIDLYFVTCSHVVMTSLWWWDYLMCVEGRLRYIIISVTQSVYHSRNLCDAGHISFQEFQ